MEDEAIALCFTDIYQGVLNLIRAATAIYESSIDCTDGRFRGRVGSAGGRRLNEEDDVEQIKERLFELRAERKRECAISITEVMATLWESSSYLAASASDCIDGVSDMAYCAADVTALLGALGQVANVAASVNISCSSNMTREESGIIDGGRRLKGRLPAALTPRAPWKAILGKKAEGTKSSRQNFLDIYARDKDKAEVAAAVQAAEEAEHVTDVEDIVDSDALEKLVNETLRLTRLRDRKIELTECVVELNQGLTAVLRAGLAINQAVKKCKHALLTTDEARRICAVDISGVIGSFTFAAEYLSFSASHCPNGFDEYAECTGVIFELVTALASLSAVGAALPVSCDPKLKDFDEGIPPDRRLAANSSEGAAILV